MMIPTTISHGAVCHCLSKYSPSMVAPIVGINMRQVVSAMSLSNKTAALFTGGCPFELGASFGCLLMYSYTIAGETRLDNMPRRNKPLTLPKRQIVQNACSSKRRFATREIAERTARELQKLHDGDTPHRTYLCVDCGKWHLTSK